MIIRPRNTPIVDRMIAKSTSATLDSLLNCASSTAKIRKIAAPKALDQEGARLGALLVLAGQLPGDEAAEVGVRPAPP